MAQRSSRKRRKQRRRARSAPPGQEQRRPRGYAASRERDEAARRALKPLPAGERPGAVTVGSIVAALLCAANLVALVIALGKGSAEPPEAVRSAIITVILGLVAWGMWGARYWGVLGMQTILALTIVLALLALLLGSYSVLQGIGLVAILLPAGVLFWLLVKAMARIQMPERPGTRS